MCMRMQGGQSQVVVEYWFTSNNEIGLDETGDKGMSQTEATYSIFDIYRNRLIRRMFSFTLFTLNQMEHYSGTTGSFSINQLFYRVL